MSIFLVGALVIVATGFLLLRAASKLGDDLGAAAAQGLVEGVAEVTGERSRSLPNSRADVPPSLDEEDLPDAA
jgi:hypothetical protein